MEINDILHRLSSSLAMIERDDFARDYQIAYGDLITYLIQKDNVIPQGTIIPENIQITVEHAQGIFRRGQNR